MKKLFLWENLHNLCKHIPDPEEEEDPPEEVDPEKDPPPKP